MSIKTRLSLTLLGVTVLLACVQLLVLQQAISPSFEALELELAEKDLHRPVDALANEVDHLRVFTRDWASWDETWAFTRGENPQYAEENLYHAVLEENSLVLIYIVDLEGTVIWGDREAPEGIQSVDLASFPTGSCPLDHPLLVDARTPQSINGVMLTEWGPMIVSAQPVLRNESAPPCVGTMVMARLVDGALIERLQDQTNVSFALLSVDADDLDPHAREDLARLRAGEQDVFEARRPGELACATLIPDILGREALLVQARVQRDVSARGRAALSLAFLLGLGGAACVLLVLHWLLHRGVVRPLTDFTEKVVQVGTSRSTGSDLALDRSDEIGVLSRKFATLFADLQEYQHQAVESSRKAGMAEIATNVLHNVGNMLNSVTVSSSVVGESVGLLPIADLRAVAERMQGLGGEVGRWVSEDPGGRQLPAYLGLMAQRLEQAQAQAARECSSLSNRVTEIAAVVQDQQRFAKGGGVWDEVELGEQIGAALRITMPERKGVEVRRGAWEQIPVVCDRHKLLHILVNLIKNAVEAFEELEREERWIEFSVTRRRDRALVEIRDNASGLPAELIERIFQHGFTTKPDGHGFGLHSAATAALELKGVLRASSPGPDQGSTFTLELPAAEPAALPHELRRAS